MVETHDDVVRRIRALGYAAKDLLSSPSYTTVLNALSEYHLAVMVETVPGPDGSARRDKAHTMIHALRDLNSEIESYVTALNEVETAEDADQDQDV